MIFFHTIVATEIILGQKLWNQHILHDWTLKIPFKKNWHYITGQNFKRGIIMLALLCNLFFCTFSHNRFLLFTSHFIPRNKQQINLLHFALVFSWINYFNNVQAYMHKISNFWTSLKLLILFHYHFYIHILYFVLIYLNL